MHQGVGQLAIGRKDEQACCRQIQATNRNPASALETRQSVEYEFAAISIFPRRNLVARLVVDDVTVRLPKPLQR